jgi:hypothetical protein
MTIIVSTMAKLLRTDEGFVKRAWSTARAADSAETQPPTEFASGKGALAFALSYFIINQPAIFVLGSLGMIAFVVYGIIHDPWLFGAGTAIASCAWYIHRVAGRCAPWMLFVGIPVVIGGAVYLYRMIGHHG